MKEFLKKYQTILWMMPVLYIAGRTFVPLSYLVFAVLLVNFRRNNQDHHIILSFLIVLVFGDSRES
ncbi:MAG: hypothetical protein KDE26_30120, partial [Bacteroidetes bacterium]|nr:hypothetical protein [Bacteroidota bacterium]